MKPLPFLLFIAMFQLRPASDIPSLIQVLKGSDWKARSDAAHALGDLGPVAKDAVPALIGCLTEPGVRGEAAFALGKIGPDAWAAVPALVDVLKKDNGRDPIAKLGAITALGQIGPDAREALPLLEKLAFDKDQMVGQAAMQAMGGIGEEGKKLQVAAAIKALGDPSEEKRWEAALTLWQAGHSAAPAVSALTAAMNDPADRIRQVVPNALGAIGEEARPAIPVLLGALKDNDSEVRDASLRALGDIRGNTSLVLPALIKALTDESVGTRVSAAEAIGKYGPEAVTAVPALAAALNDPEVSVRVTVTKSLGAIGHGAGAEAALQKALQDNASTVRHAAAVAVGTEAEPKSGNPEEGVEPMVVELQTLLNFLNGGGPDARRAAAGLIKLCRNPNPGIVLSLSSYVPGPWLKKCAVTDFVPPVPALRDQDALVRRVALEAMAALGPKAKGALPELLTALKDRDFGVRKGVLQALLYMGADAAPAVPELVQMLQDDSENLWLLLGVLDGIGKDATPALPRLLSVFRNKQMIPETRKFALEAMVRIDESSAETQTALQEAKSDPDGSVRAKASSLEGFNREHIH